MKVGNVLENVLVALIDDALEERDIGLGILVFAEVAFFEFQPRATGKRLAALEDKLGKYEQPDIDGAFLILVIVVDLFHVQIDRLSDGLVLVEGARRLVERLGVNLTLNQLAGVEDQTERFLKAGEVREVQAI